MKLFSLMFALLIFSTSAQALVVGKVDIQKILETISEGKRVKSQLEKEFKSKQKELQKEEATIRDLQKKFEKQSLVMAEKAKRDKQNEIAAKIQQLQSTSQRFQKEIQEMERKLKKPILDKLKAVIEEVSKAEKVDMTFEVSTAPIVYAKSKKDLTNKVVKAYNKKHK